MFCLVVEGAQFDRSLCIHTDWWNANLPQNFRSSAQYTHPPEPDVTLASLLVIVNGYIYS
jgi:hypothetical protein